MTGGSTPTATRLDTAEGRRRGRGVAEWTVDATQNVSDIICQNKLFDVVASQRKCVHPPLPLFSRSPACLMTPSLVCPAQLQFCLSLSHSSLAPSLLSRSFVVSVSKQQQTAASCMTALCRLPLATRHLPLATRLPSAMFIIIIATRVQRSAKILLLLVTAFSHPLSHCLRHTLATKLINLLQRHQVQSQFIFRSFLLIECELKLNCALDLVYYTN